MCEEYIPKEKPAATACEEDIPRKNKPAASAVYKVLNQEGVISSRVLTHKSRSNRKEIRPFLCDYECVFRDEEADQHENKMHDGMPKWWDAYNKSKHRLPEGYEARQHRKHVPCVGRTIRPARHGARIPARGICLYEERPLGDAHPVPTWQHQDAIPATRRRGTAIRDLHVKDKISQ